MCFCIPWKAWYGPEELKLSFPEEWPVATFGMKNGPALAEREIMETIRNPYGALPLNILAKGKKNAVIAVDDLSRPTQAQRILPLVIDELVAAGMETANILILVAFGGHRAMHRFDLIRKFGSAIVENFTIYNHSAFYNLEYCGISSQGTPIYLNKFFLEADLKIGIGSILPHPNAGFGGGGKIVLPGVAGAETIIANHTRTLAGHVGGLIEVDHNENRSDIEEVAFKAGLNFIVNQVPNDLGEVAGIFAGDLVKAHREGVKFGLEVFSTPKPKTQLDVAIVNSFPMDTDLIQIEKALNVFGPGNEDVVKPGGTIVIIGACSEGRGYHMLGDYQLPLWQTIDKNEHTYKVIGNKNLIVFSPNLRQRDVLDYYPPYTKLCTSWEEVLRILCINHPKGANVGIFPCSCLQILR